MQQYIHFEDVKKIYHIDEVQIEALSGMDFSVDKGEFVVVLGTSGAGKSTILNILGGMDRASSGLVQVNGETISEYNERVLTRYRRDQVGFIFQIYNLVLFLECCGKNTRTSFIPEKYALRYTIPAHPKRHFIVIC